MSMFKPVLLFTFSSSALKCYFSSKAEHTSQVSLNKKVAEGAEPFKLAATIVNIINKEYKLYKKFRLNN